MAESQNVKMTGLGFVLPDTAENGICDTKERFWEIVRNGECVLSETPEYRAYDVGIAGKIHQWDIENLGILQKHLDKYSKPTLMSIMALKKAMEDAGYSRKDLSNDKTLLILSSAMLTLEAVGRQYETLRKEGSDKVRFDFFIQGTPGSIATGVSKVLELDCPVLTLTGSCVTTAQAIQIACEKLSTGIAEKVILIGVDDTLDPLYFSSVTHRMKNGESIAAITDDPEDIRPHDVRAMGNAPGQGAIAVILEKEESGQPCSQGTCPIKLYYRNSRKNGHSLFDCGPPDNFADSMEKVLGEAGITLDGIGFINDFTEGTGFISEFFADVLNMVGEKFNSDRKIYLTNQEAAFGHIAGIAGLIKLVGNVMMMKQGIIAPCINCEQPDERIKGIPVVGCEKEMETDYSMIIGCGAGGDCSITVVKRIGE